MVSRGIPAVKARGAAHLRAGDWRLPWPLLYPSLAGAALPTGLAHHGPLG